jgi:hypothetical protein
LLQTALWFEVSEMVKSEVSCLEVVERPFQTGFSVWKTCPFGQVFQTITSFPSPGAPFLDELRTCFVFFFSLLFGPRGAVSSATTKKTDLQMKVYWLLEHVLLLLSTGLIYQNIDVEHLQPVSVSLSRVGRTIWGPCPFDINCKARDGKNILSYLPIVMHH